MATLPPLSDAEAQPSKKRKPTALYIVLGICIGACICPLLLGALLFPVFAQAREAAQMKVCAYNMTAIGNSINEFVAKTGHYPSTLRDINPASSAFPSCPKLQRHEFALGYAYNAVFYADKKPSEVVSYKDEPILIEVDDPHGNDLLGPQSKFAKRHMNGRYVNAYYQDNGIRRAKLTDAQMDMPIEDVLRGHQLLGSATINN